MLRNVNDELASAVAAGLGLPLPPAMPRLIDPPAVEVEVSPSLSLTFRPGGGDIRGRKVAVLLAPGVDARSVTTVQKALARRGAVVRLLAVRLGRVGSGRSALASDATFETSPSVLYDAVVIPDGAESAEELASLGQALEFLKDQYRHCKPILVLGAGTSVLEAAGLPGEDEADWALTHELPAFLEAVGRHRNWERATDPPAV
jgi:catalase